MKLGLKLLGIISVLTTVTIGGIFFSIKNVEYTNGVREQKNLMWGILDNALFTLEQQAKTQSYHDYSKLAEELKQHEDYHDSMLFKSTPIVASWTMAREEAKKHNMTLRVVKEHPRNDDNLPSEAELKILKTLQSSKDEHFFSDEKIDGKEVLTFAHRLVADQSCLMCHGNPDTSPTHNGKDLLGFKMESWTEGQFIGAMILTGDMAGKNADNRAMVISTAKQSTVVALLGFGVLVFSIKKLITDPLALMKKSAKLMSQGDLTSHIELKTKDEIGDVVTAFNETTDNLRSMVRQISDESKGLDESAKQLTNSSDSLVRGAEEMNSRSATVAAAGEQLSVNIRNMADSAGHISNSSSSVAAAVEEMTASVQEVARNCARESEIAVKADSQAKATKETMDRLNVAAEEIGKVTAVINNIAERTNILALNATIEAASAGEAGRGFAVVAHEVKELARQCTDATNQIQKQIERIQNDTTASSKAIDEVARVISDVTDISASIAAAIEEQSATTGEISKALHTVSTETQALSRNVHEASAGANEVSHNIQGVSQNAATTNKIAEASAQDAVRLADASKRLNQIVSTFRI